MKLISLPTLTTLDNNYHVLAITRDQTKPTGFRNENVLGSRFSPTTNQGSAINGSFPQPFSSSYSGEIETNSNPSYVPAQPYQGIYDDTRVNDFLFMANLSNLQYDSNTATVGVQFYPNTVTSSGYVLSPTIIQYDGYASYVPGYAEINVTVADHDDGSVANMIYVVGSYDWRTTRLNRRFAGPSGSTLDVAPIIQGTVFDVPTDFATPTAELVTKQAMTQFLGSSPPTYTTDRSVYLLMGAYKEINTLTNVETIGTYILACVHPSVIRSTNIFRLGFKMRMRRHSYNLERGFN